jgi:hypothetical protein
MLDDAHARGARITLEHGGGMPFAITCGIDGWMVHTRFFLSEVDARLAFEAMKEALDTIIQSIPNTNDPDCEAKVKGVHNRIRAFVDRFP